MVESLTINGKDFGGLRPAIDPRRTGQAHVIQGSNFIFDVDGPKSWFGSDIRGYGKLVDGLGIQSFRVEDRSFIFTQNAVLEFDETMRLYRVLYEFASSVVTAYPWTTAFVGTKYYFCHPDIGILFYCIGEKTFSKLTGTYVPDVPYAITDAYGRLVILSETAYLWSALDDGSDLTPDLVTGAGFQSLGLIGGTPISVGKITDGFLVFTSKGIVKAQFTNNSAVFRHYVWDTTHVLLTPYCLISIEENGLLFLSRNGFWQTKGDAPEAFAPVMSEYFKDVVIPAIDDRINDIVRIDYSKGEEILFVGVGSAAEASAYIETWVLYLPMADKWGKFTRKHYGFCEVYLDSGPRQGFNFCNISASGVVNIFHDLSYVETHPNLNVYRDDSLWVPPYEEDAIFIEGAYIARTHSVGTHFDPIAFKDLPTGYYAVGTSVYTESALPEAPAEVEPFYSSSAYNVITFTGGVSALRLENAAASDETTQSLNSDITLGLFNFTSGTKADETSAVDTLRVDTSTLSSSSLDEDWLLDDLNDEDWNLIDNVEEDWGYNLASGIEFNAYLLTTWDGRQLTDFGRETLEVYQNFEAGILYDPRGISGMFHSLQLSADQIGYSYHLKSLEIGAILTGRYQG